MIYFHCTVCVAENGGRLEVLVVDMGLDLRKQFIWGRLENCFFWFIKFRGGLVIHLAISKNVLFLYKSMKNKPGVTNRILHLVWVG